MVQILYFSILLFIVILSMNSDINNKSDYYNMEQTDKKAIANKKPNILQSVKKTIENCIVCQQKQQKVKKYNNISILPEEVNEDISELIDIETGKFKPNILDKLYERYSNTDLTQKITDCMLDLEWQWYEFKEEQSFVELVQEKHLVKRSWEKYILGNGTFGFIFASTDKTSVYKIFHFFDSSQSTFDIMGEEGMPLEYCVQKLTPSDHILKPDNFNKISMPIQMITSKKNPLEVIELITSKNLVFRNLIMNDLEKSYSVPMYRMDRCENIDWLKQFTQKPIYYFIEMLNMVEDIHKNGISISDIQPGNIMNCDGKIKFIDMGFAKFISRINDYKNDTEYYKLMFGTIPYRSPWAHFLSSSTNFEKFDVDIQDKMSWELLSNDFWSVATMFLEKLCGIKLWDIVPDIKHGFLNPSYTFYNKYDKSEVEATNYVQNKIKIILNDLKSKKQNKKCPIKLQETLENVLQVDPKKRFQNVQSILNNVQFIK